MGCAKKVPFLHGRLTRLFKSVMTPGLFQSLGPIIRPTRPPFVSIMTVVGRFLTMRACESSSCSSSKTSKCSIEIIPKIRDVLRPDIGGDGEESKPFRV